MSLLAMMRRCILAKWDRTCHELVFLASFGSGPKHKAFPSIFDLVAREHSRKPDVFYRMVVERMPDQDRCDLFSRETRPGLTAGDGSTASSTKWRDESSITIAGQTYSAL
jgi:N6-adenosine-specific RNA methylase IME4